MSRISIPSSCNKAQVTFEVVEVRESMSFKISVWDMLKALIFCTLIACELVLLKIAHLPLVLQPIVARRCARRALTCFEKHQVPWCSRSMLCGSYFILPCSDAIMLSLLSIVYDYQGDKVWCYEIELPPFRSLSEKNMLISEAQRVIYNRTPIFEQSMSRIVVKNEHHKDTCYNGISLYAQVC